MVVFVHPGGTSITCHKCGHKDENSRASQARFQCTNDKCKNDINADVNAAHNIAVKAMAGRRGSSSQGARFQAGIAPGRSASKHESQVPEGSLERQKKAKVPFTFRDYA